MKTPTIARHAAAVAELTMAVRVIPLAGAGRHFSQRPADWISR